MQLLQQDTCAPQQCPAYGKACAPDVGRRATTKRCAEARTIMCNAHESEVKMAQDFQDEEIEMVSIDSVHLNRNWSVITAYLDIYAGKNNVEIPYKIDMGSEGNIMPLYIFKKLFKNVMVEQLKKSIRKSHQAMHIQLYKHYAIRDMCGSHQI